MSTHCPYETLFLLERQSPGRVITLMQDTLSDIIFLQVNTHSDNVTEVTDPRGSASRTPGVPFEKRTPGVQLSRGDQSERSAEPAGYETIPPAPDYISLCRPLHHPQSPHA